MVLCPYAVLVARPVASYRVIVTAAAAAATPGPPSETPAGHSRSRHRRTDRTRSPGLLGRTRRRPGLNARAGVRTLARSHAGRRSGHAEAAHHTARPPPKLRSPPSEHFVLVAASGARKRLWCQLVWFGWLLLPYKLYSLTDCSGAFSPVQKWSCSAVRRTQP